MNQRTLLARSLRYHALTHLVTAAGIAVATAVLAGALLVGDSVRTSLRRLVEERLGHIDRLLLPEVFFREELVREFRQSREFAKECQSAVGICFIPGVTLDAAQVQRGRVGNVQCLGMTEDFWQLDAWGVRPRVMPQGRQVVVNQRLASELGLRQGDHVTLRLPVTAQVPAESTFGRRETDLKPLIDLEIVDIVPDRGFGRFDVRSSQRVPFLAYCERDVVQRALGKRGRVNAMLVADQHPPGQNREGAPGEGPTLRPKLEDFGLRLERVTATYSPRGTDPIEATKKTAWSYWNVVSDRMVWQPELRAAVMQALRPDSAQEVSTYLANSIERVPSGDPADPVLSIPYSTICAMDNPPVLGPLTGHEGEFLTPLSDDACALNAWAADRLGVRVGDSIGFRYFLPETTHGIPRETSTVLKLAAIVPFREP
ncbi:MAG TPA: hypothetical protein VIY86_06540, partial [Pirellulaceae bacterium]